MIITKKAGDFKNKKFNYIFLSDVVEHLEKPEEMFYEIGKIMTNKTKLIITMANPIWEPVLLIAEKLNMKMPKGKHQRLSFSEVENIIHKSGLKIGKHDYKLLLPIKLPITNFVNRYLEKYFKKYSFIEYFEVMLATKP